MDEPLSNLDAKLRLHMRTEIATLQKRLATTTLYVTHDQVEAMTLGDRVAAYGDLRHRLTRDQLASLGGDRVTIGVRPESWVIDDCNGLDVHVDVVETLGPDVLAHCSLPDRTQLVARLPRADIAVGERIRLSTCSDAVHVFDPVSTHRLTS